MTSSRLNIKLYYFLLIVCDLSQAILYLDMVVVPPIWESELLLLGIPMGWSCIVFFYRLYDSTTRRFIEIEKKHHRGFVVTVLVALLLGYLSGYLGYFVFYIFYISWAFFIYATIAIGIKLLNPESKNAL